MRLKKLEPVFLTLIGLIISFWFASVTLFELVGANVMDARPWSIIQYVDYADLTEYWIAVAAGAAPPIMLAAMIFMPKKESIHGDAKWASAADVKKAGMQAKGGILLGGFKGRYLITEEPAHFLVCAPTRSGKGVGIIIPNLLNFDGSTIVYDIKFENWEKTAGFRAAHGHKVFLWSPMNPNGTTHSYNPLDRVRNDPLFRLSDAMSLASYLIPLPKKDPIWDQLARFFFTGLILYTLDRAKREGSPATIGEIYRTLSDHADMREWAMETAILPWIDPECRRLLLSFAGMTDKERSFVKTSIAKSLNLWSNPLVDAATSRSDFDLRDLRRKRMAIYVGVTVDTKDAVAPLVALFFQQAIAALTQREPDEDEPHKVLFLMDEFASLGRMELVANAVTMLASYGGRLMFILQALSTLDEHYGRNGREIILQNCAYQVFFAASDETTTRYVTARLGKKTVKSTSRTQSKGGVSRSTSEQSRDLMLPQEFQQMSRARQVVLVEAARPVLADKIRYFEDADFIARVLEPPLVPKVEIKGRPQIAAAIDAGKPGQPSQAAIAFAEGQSPPEPRARAAEPPVPPPATVAAAPRAPLADAAVGIDESAAANSSDDKNLNALVANALEDDGLDDLDALLDAALVDANTAEDENSSGDAPSVEVSASDVSEVTTIMTTAFGALLDIETDDPEIAARQKELRAFLSDTA